MNPLSMLGPILASLKSHRSAALLLAAEIALTLAVLCNLIFIVAGTEHRSRIPTGTDEANIGVIQNIGVIGTHDDSSSTRKSLAALQAVPGVQAAAFGLPPFSADRVSLFLAADARQPATEGYLFFGSQGLDRTLGVRVLAGQGLQDLQIPTPDDVFSDPAAATARPPAQVPALVTPSLARRLFQAGSPLGKVIHASVWGTPVSLRIVGVMAPIRGEISGRQEDADAVLAEVKVSDQGWGGIYLVRSAPGQLSQVLPLAAKALQAVSPNSVQSAVKPFSQVKEEYFGNDRAVARMLSAIAAILLAATALGVGGLASFWVQQRTKQIGIRRALGATRRDILAYFQLENLLIVGGGGIAGIALAFALNQWLMQKFELDRLPPSAVLAGLATVLVLGQLAVLGPALRAASVPPVVATRST